MSYMKRIVDCIIDDYESGMNVDDLAKKYSRFKRIEIIALIDDYMGYDD